MNYFPCVLRNGSRCLMRLRKVACWLHRNHKHHMVASQLMRNMKSQEWERTGTVNVMLNTICYCHLLIYLFYRFNKAKLNDMSYCIPVLQCFRDAELLKILWSGDMAVYALHFVTQEPGFSLLHAATVPWEWQWRNI